MKKTTIICNACGKDITDSAWRIVLFEDGNANAANLLYVIREDKHFCNMACLRKWANE